jgi:regulator of cell morphogenesis and NO signaling
MIINKEMKIGQIATEHPLLTRVFSRHKIDFCCGGGLPLSKVCENKNLDVAALLEEFNTELLDENESEEHWDQVTASELIDHILEKYHQPLYEEMPRLLKMALKVNEVHGAKDPVRLSELVSVIKALIADLEQHMKKEEEILFPMIKSGHTAMTSGPVNVMLMEHDEVGEILKQLRILTSDYTAPKDACNTWVALWKGLEALESDLHQHIHLENNILFPMINGE